jgi:hypothetical protein
VVIVEVFVEGRFMVLELSIFGIFPLLELGVEVPSPWLGFKKSASIQAWTEGGEMTGSVPGANTAEVAGAIDLSMSFLAAVTTNKVGIVAHSITVPEAFLRRGAFIGAGILGNLYSSRDDGFRIFNDGGGDGGWSRGGREWGGRALIQRGVAMGQSKGVRDRFSVLLSGGMASSSGTDCDLCAAPGWQVGVSGCRGEGGVV